MALEILYKYFPLINNYLERIKFQHMIDTFKSHINDNYQKKKNILMRYFNSNTKQCVYSLFEKNNRILNIQFIKSRSKKFDSDKYIAYINFNSRSAARKTLK